MMLQIQSYTFTGQFYDSRETVMYRGFASADAQKVVAKLPKSPYPSVRELSKLRHEYAILQTLNIPGVVKAKALLPYRNSLALILEEVRGKALNTLLQEKSPPLAVALKIASRLAGIVAALHRQGIIHKDIKPQKIASVEKSPLLVLTPSGRLRTTVCFPRSYSARHIAQEE